MWNVFLSIRYFLAKRKQGIISFINLTSVIGVALGVASLIIVMSVMNGFDLEVKKKIIGTYAPIVVSREAGNIPVGDIPLIERSLPGIKKAAGFITGQAVLAKDGNVVGVLLKGIDVEKEKKVTDVLSYIKMEEEGLKGNNIVLGSELMRNIGAVRGDIVEIIVPYSIIDQEKVKFKVVGSFRSGRYDYDSNIAVIDLATAQKLYRTGDTVSAVAVKVPDDDVVKMKQGLEAVLGFPYIVKSWMDLDRNLVAALAMEKKMMFIILGLVIFVACFNITGSLVMMVMEKTRDIGILKAIGGSSWGVSSVFFLEGFFIGALGISIGSIGGVYFSQRINDIAEFIQRVTGYEVFPSDVYYFSEIPVKVSSSDVSTIIVFAMALVLIAGFYPAWKASRLDPVEAIRYE